MFRHDVSSSATLHLKAPNNCICGCIFTWLRFHKIRLKYLLTYSMEERRSWEANRSSASRKFPAFYGTRKFIAAFTTARHLSVSWARPIQSFPLLRLYPRIIPVPRLWSLFLNMANFLLWGVVSTSPNPQAGGPHTVSCPRPVIQYIRSYPTYLEVVPPSATWGRAQLRYCTVFFDWSSYLMIVVSDMVHLLVNKDVLSKNVQCGWRQNSSRVCIR